MPKIAKKMTLREIKQLKKTGVYAIGHVPGLAVRVNASGGSSYVFRYKVKGLERVLTIGPIYVLTLKDATTEAMHYKIMLLRHEDPVLYNKTKKEEMAKKVFDARNVTIDKHAFGLVANEFLTMRKESEAFANNAKAEANAASMLINHVFPYIKDRPISEITCQDICNVLSKIWKDKPSLSTKIQGLLKQIFDYANAMKYYPHAINPAALDGPLKVLLQPYSVNRPGVKHFASLDFKEMPDLFVELWNKGGNRGGLSALAVMFSILTATRSKAVRFLTWHQLDLKDCSWEIPVTSDKIKRADADRTIFLSKQAKLLLERIPHKAELVFPNNKLAALSDGAFGKVIHDINADRVQNNKPAFVDHNILDENGKPKEITQHGTARASFKTWSKDDELGHNRTFSSEAVERCLLHTPKDPLKGAYDRAKLEKERRFIMDEWGKFCCSKIPELNQD